MGRIENKDQRSDSSDSMSSLVVVFHPGNSLKISLKSMGYSCLPLMSNDHLGKGIFRVYI